MAESIAKVRKTRFKRYLLFFFFFVKDNFSLAVLRSPFRNRKLRGESVKFSLFLSFFSSRINREIQLSPREINPEGKFSPNLSRIKLVTSVPKLCPGKWIFHSESHMGPPAPTKTIWRIARRLPGIQSPADDAPRRPDIWSREISPTSAISFTSASHLRWRCESDVPGLPHDHAKGLARGWTGGRRGSRASVRAYPIPR